MSQNTQRLSQTVSTFGPGAMVDLPTRSVVIGGLNQWEMRTVKVISEPRLTTRLERLLSDQNRLAEGTKLQLRVPPVADTATFGLPDGIRSFIFPKWFVCERTEPGSGPIDRRRRLVPWQDLAANGRRRYTFDDGKASEVTPIRFVCACEKGHLQDIDWRRVVHGPDRCQERMWVEEKGTSADPADTAVICACGKRLSLQELFQPGRLGTCDGERPWLLDRDPNGCGEKLKLLTRTATNTYFPQVLTVISLPSEEDALSAIVQTFEGVLKDAQSAADIAQAKKYNPNVASALGGYSDEDIFDRLQRIREGAQAQSNLGPKNAEFDTFASGRTEIGQNTPEAKLYCQTLPRSIWDGTLLYPSIRSLVAVHRLREVSCLYGFTRFEAAPTSADGDIEDIALAVRGAPISEGCDWLPAVEQFGEGLFIHFDEREILQWLNKENVRARQDKLLHGFEKWANRLGKSAPRYPGTAYILLHSLSHALMQEIALDCGYPASSLKERVYAHSSVQGGMVDRCGLLIYTASAGAQGTLGGLVSIVPRFSEILRTALRRTAICSNDPICADHEPDGYTGDRATHGAACHSCLLVAETSCEARNLFLDRALRWRQCPKPKRHSFPRAAQVKGDRHRLCSLPKRPVDRGATDLESLGDLRGSYPLGLHLAHLGHVNRGGPALVDPSRLGLRDALKLALPT
jgi:hypothetical protein